MTPEAYTHFLFLSLGYRILFSANLSPEKINTAEKLLHSFVGRFKRFYNRNLPYNVHGLLHLADCCRIYGTVDKFSTYRFDNSIFLLQGLIRSNTNIFSQINNRIYERNAAGYTREGTAKRTNYSNRRNQFHRIKEGVDSMGRDTYKYVKVVDYNSTLDTVGVRAFLKTSNFFEKPIPSTSFGIVEVKMDDLGQIFKVKISELEVCYALPSTILKEVDGIGSADGNIVIIPLVHL